MWLRRKETLWHPKFHALCSLQPSPGRFLSIPLLPSLVLRGLGMLLHPLWGWGSLPGLPAQGTGVSPQVLGGVSPQVSGVCVSPGVGVCPQVLGSSTCCLPAVSPRLCPRCSPELSLLLVKVSVALLVLQGRAQGCSSSSGAQPSVPHLWGEDWGTLVAPQCRSQPPGPEDGPALQGGGH